MDRRRSIVMNLYKCLSDGDMNSGSALLAADLDWRYHGPPGREHMMRVLTGDDEPEFRFRPRRVAEMGKWVVAEGWEVSHAGENYWVHAWVVVEEVITEFREYFNTRVTVREFGPTLGLAEPAVWKSRDRPERPLPCLVLAV